MSHRISEDLMSILPSSKSSPNLGSTVADSKSPVKRVLKRGKLDFLVTNNNNVISSNSQQTQERRKMFKYILDFYIILKMLRFQPDSPKNIVISESGRIMAGTI